LCDRKNWYKSQLLLAMPQGYRAKDHVVIKTYSGSSRPQSVFDWVSTNLASRVHQIHNDKLLTNEWYQFERKSKKVGIIYSLKDFGRGFKSAANAVIDVQIFFLQVCG